MSIWEFVEIMVTDITAERKCVEGDENGTRVKPTFKQYTMGAERTFLEQKGKEREGENML